MNILYKYVTPRRALTCIPEVGDGTLRATQPAALNDPFECAVTTLYVFKNKAEENRELAQVLTDINESKPVTEEYVGRAMGKYGSLFTRQLLTEQVSTRFGIVSFTTHPHHPLMWSHYTTDGSGFVIGYDFEELRKLTGPNGWLRSVQYGDKPAPIIGPNVLVFPESNLPGLLSLKSDHWSYEDEWCLIVKLNRTIGTGKTDQHGQPINLVRVPNEAVVSVYYTERTPHETVNLIQDRLADRNNRYGAGNPRKLVLSTISYGYEPVFPILGVFRLNGQPKRDGSIIVRSCKATQSPVYPIRDAILAVNHASCPSLSSSGPRQWGESALKTSRFPGALSLLAKSWLYPPSAWRRR